MRISDDHVDVDAYVVGDLGAHEVGAIEEHLRGCSACRAEVASLREVQELLRALPPEASLEGPPDDADLLLQRTLRQVRAEGSRVRGRRTGRLVAAAVVVAIVGLGGGVLVGRSTVESGPVVAASPGSPGAGAAVAPGTRVASALDANTGARLTVHVVPAAGWVRLDAAVTGIPQGQPCRLIVVARDGRRETAGGWLVSAKGAAEGVTLAGSALIDPAMVAAVVVENTGGQQFVRVDV